MSKELNPNYNPATTAGKAATEGGVVLGGATLGALLGSLAVNSLRNAGKAPWTPDLDGYAVTVASGLMASAFAGLKKAARNIRKHRWLSVVAIMGLTIALSGCVATKAADGTWTVEVDRGALDDAWKRYETLEARRATLERERRTATGDRLDAVIAEIEKLEPQIRELGDVLGINLPERP